jgi:hypothetical protein
MLFSNGKVVGGKARAKEPLGRPRRRWLNNIRMDLADPGLVWAQVESSCKFGIEALGSINCWETIECPNN